MPLIIGLEYYLLGLAKSPLVLFKLNKPKNERRIGEVQAQQI